MENNTNIKKNYKKAPLSEVHIRVLIAVILGQIACGFALGISGTALTNASKYIQINSLWTGLIGAGSLNWFGRQYRRWPFIRQNRSAKTTDDQHVYSCWSYTITLINC